MTGGNVMAENLPSKDSWLIYDRGQNHGPLPWNEVSYKVNNKQISSSALIKNELWPNWVPISYYFHPAQLRDAEMMGLIPSRYDALLYGGFALFFVGLFGLFIRPIVGIAFLILSPVVEIYAIILERKNRPKAVTSTIGNIFALIWIFIQVFVTIIMINAVIL
jgi:hypothetical protein